jgi:hypothetical protein
MSKKVVKSGQIIVIKKRMSEVTQKTIEQYFLEIAVPEDKREKVIIGTTRQIYSRNQSVIAWEKETNPAEKAKLAAKVTEADATILQRITEILNGQEPDLRYEF